VWATRAGVACLLAAVLTGTGCTAITIAGMVKDAGVTASVTATGDHARLLNLAGVLRHRFGVETTIRAVRTGACIIEIIGTYAAVVDALHWMAIQGIGLVANNLATEAVLEVAIACLK